MGEMMHFCGGIPYGKGIRYYNRGASRRESFPKRGDVHLKTQERATYLAACPEGKVLPAMTHGTFIPPTCHDPLVHSRSRHRRVG